MDSGRNYSSGRGGGAGGRGSGGGRGNYQGQGGRGRSGGRRGNYPDQGGRGRGNDQIQPSQDDGRGWTASQRRSHQQHFPQQQCVNRPPVQSNQPAPPTAWGYRPPQISTPNWPELVGVGPPSGRSGPSAARPWGPSSSTLPPSPLPHIPPQPSADQLGKTLSSLSITEDQIQPISRPDRGGTVAVRSIGLLVNHFHVGFDKEMTIIHYDVDVKFMPPNGGRPLKKPLRKSETRFIKDQLFINDQQFLGGQLKTAYDGEKNIFSAIRLPEGEFQVVIAEGEDLRSGSYMVTIKAVNELKLSKLNDYLRGNLNNIPRDTLQGMDIVMKENFLRKRIPLGRCFFSRDGGRGLGGGLEALKGSHQSLKLTSNGMALCVDYSVLSFREPLPVIEFLKKHVPGFGDANDVKKMRRSVEKALIGLKVKVTHRRTNQKYTIAGLASKDARDSYFEHTDPEGVNPPRTINILNYFRDKWGKDVEHPNIPCLELGKNNKSNEVPMEFCVLVEGQRFPKDQLDKNTGLLLKNLTLVKPWDRMKAINEMVRAEDGPHGEISRSFGIELDVNMTKVAGRVIGPPELKTGDPRPVKVDEQKCQWNLLGKSFVDSKSLERWALIDFTDGDRYNRLQADAFINNLRGRCRNLGIQMAPPLVRRATRMIEFSSIQRLEILLNNVVAEAGRESKDKLQMIVCVMAKRDPGYKLLKWVSETRIGVVSQCCLSFNANKGQDQYLANLCLKINAKLGGSNFEVRGKLLHFDAQEHVMFIGADVNHPAPMNKLCPSIAAVVGTVNWPAANRYAARVSPQAHRCEKINNFGGMCLDLVQTYEQINKVKPKRIVVFRDGVSEGQFEMVLGQELLDLKRSVCVRGYDPPITIIVAQKRHQTRLFAENRNDGGQSGNVPPGTVVDTTIVDPRNFDFYLCSHYGGLGTSKPTHYYVLYDENRFSSDELQKLIYNMCFTFVRCTKPVSLVPPVYYADLVAYRGRMFQEVAMDIEQGASFDQRFYNLHSDLENVMFFV